MIAIRRLALGLALSLCGCALPVRVKSVVPISDVTPRYEYGACAALDEVPDEPEMPTWPSDTSEDVMSRMTVHLRDFMALIDYEQQVHGWLLNARECLEKMRGGRP